MLWIDNPRPPPLPQATHPHLLLSSSRCRVRELGEKSAPPSPFLPCPFNPPPRQHPHQPLPIQRGPLGAGGPRDQLFFSTNVLSAIDRTFFCQQIWVHDFFSSIKKGRAAGAVSWQICFPFFPHTDRTLSINGWGSARAGDVCWVVITWYHSSRPTYGVATVSRID